MTFLARWRTPPPARINDVAIYADEADAWWDERSPVFRPLRAMIPARVAFLERQRVAFEGAVAADVGAGGGYLTLELAQRGARVVAIDLAAPALRAADDERARRGIDARRVQTLVASAEDLPLAPARFSFVACTDVLVHVPNRARALDELARVVAPGGLLYVASMNRTALARFIVIFLGEDVLGLVARGTHDYDTFITPDDMKREMNARGFELVAVEGVGPTGVSLRGPTRGLTFGRSPTRAVMYHALFRLHQQRHAD